MRERQPSNQSQGAMEAPQFSAEFIAEVADCTDTDAFRALLDRRGLWLNLRAATDVFDYLRSLSKPAGGAISDDELAGVIGGVTVSPVDSGSLGPLLAEVAHQLH